MYDNMIQHQVLRNVPFSGVVTSLWYAIRYISAFHAHKSPLSPEFPQTTGRPWRILAQIQPWHQWIRRKRVLEKVLRPKKAMLLQNFWVFWSQLYNFYLIFKFGSYTKVFFGIAIGSNIVGQILSSSCDYSYNSLFKHFLIWWKRYVTVSCSVFATQEDISEFRRCTYPAIQSEVVPLHGNFYVTGRYLSLR